MENNDIDYSKMSQFAKEAMFIADFAVFYETRKSLNDETKIKHIRKYINSRPVDNSYSKPAVTTTTAQRAPRPKKETTDTAKLQAKRGRKPGTKLIKK